MLNSQKYAPGGSAGYELCEVYYFRSPTLRPGFQPAHGGLLSLINGRPVPEVYPEAWDFLQTPEGQLLCKTEADWKTLSNAAPWNGIGGVPWFVQDLAAGTLRLPDLRGMYPEAANFDGLGVGETHGDAIRPATGTVKTLKSAGSALSGVFTFSRVAGSVNKSSTDFDEGTLTMDISRVMPVANKIQPRAWGALACVYLGQPQGV